MKNDWRAYWGAELATFYDFVRNQLGTYAPTYIQFTRWIEYNSHGIMNLYAGKLRKHTAPNIRMPSSLLVPSTTVMHAEELEAVRMVVEFELMVECEKRFLPFLDRFRSPLPTQSPAPSSSDEHDATDDEMYMEPEMEGGYGMNEE